MSRHSALALSLITAVLLAACGDNSLAIRPGNATPATVATTTAPTTPPTTKPTAAVKTPAQIAEEVGPSAVMIRADFPETAVTEAGSGSGTGIVLDEEGYIITNAHVVEGASAVTVATSGKNRSRPADIIATSACDDLAIIKVNDTEGLVPAVFGSSSDLKVGEEVVALGYPISDDFNTELSVTRGVVSKRDATVGHYEHLIQTDAAINPGNSGGPLVNQRGEVIGINSIGIDPTVATNVNFAINVDKSQGVIGKLKEGHNIDWLGMNLVPNAYADYFGYEEGMVVAGVDSGSPSSRVGVEPADLLTKLEGQAVQSQTDVCKILRSHSDGDHLKLELLRISNTRRLLLQGEVVIGDPKATAELEKVQIVAEESTDTSANNNSNSGQDPNYNYLAYDFESNDNSWFSGQTERTFSEIKDGYYTILLRAPDTYVLRRPQELIEGSDMAIVADVFVHGDARAGVALRFSTSNDTNNAYICWIDGSNRYGCYMLVGNQPTTLQEPATAGPILPGQVNRVVLSTSGSDILFRVNGTDIARFSDRTIASGEPALYVENFSTEAGASFDNVTIITPK